MIKFQPKLQNNFPLTLDVFVLEDFSCYQSCLLSYFTPHAGNLALTIALLYARVRVRATVKLSAVFFHDESSITIGGRGYESAIAPVI